MQIEGTEFLEENEKDVASALQRLSGYKFKNSETQRWFNFVVSNELKKYYRRNNEKMVRLFLNDFINTTMKISMLNNIMTIKENSDKAEELGIKKELEEEMKQKQPQLLMSTEPMIIEEEKKEEGEGSEPSALEAPESISIFDKKPDEDIFPKKESKGKESKFADKPYLWSGMFYSGSQIPDTFQYQKLFSRPRFAKLTKEEQKDEELKSQAVAYYNDIKGTKVENYGDFMWDKIKEHIEENLGKKVEEINDLINHAKRSPGNVSNSDLSDITSALFELRESNIGFNSGDYMFPILIGDKTKTKLGKATKQISRLSDWLAGKTNEFIPDASYQYAKIKTEELIREGKILEKKKKDMYMNKFQQDYDDLSESKKEEIKKQMGLTN